MNELHESTCCRFTPNKVALAVSLNLRTFLELKATSRGKVCVDLPNIDTSLSWDVSELRMLLSASLGEDDDDDDDDEEPFQYTACHVTTTLW